MTNELKDRELSASGAEKDALPSGLTALEVKAQKDAGRVNVSRIRAGKSYGRIVRDNLCTYFNLIYALVSLVLICFGSFGNLTYLAVVLPNVIIAIVQEWRAKATVEKLSVTTDPRATVVRDGALCDIDASELVVGDVMRVELGRQVLSDAILTEGLCEANESMLTGESVPVRKEAGDRLFAGSFIVSGSAYARVDRVGNDNYVSTLEKSAKAFKAPSSNLFRDLTRLIKVIGWFIIPFAAALFASNWFSLASDTLPMGSFEHIKLVVEKVCGSVVGMIPAGMYLLVTLALSLSVITLGRKGTLVQDMYSIEMLASADVVCLDKTGTITDGTMEVTDVIPLGGTDGGEIERIMSYLEGEDDAINPTSRALIARFGKVRGRLIDRIPFSSARKYSQADIEEIGCYAIGAPHFVPAEISREVDRIIDSRAALGERVLVLARIDGEGVGTAVGLIAIADRIRPSAKETIAKFQENDVTVKVISGDHAATVSTIAARVGIKDADKYISCESLSDEELVASVDSYAVFGRVTPEQKVLLVKALKAKGHTVAMTGDGVNDTLALKESNCAIAMADGSEVARKVSQIVLMNSDFSTLPDVVREGRRCINNVRQSASLFIMKTIFTILVTLFAIVTVSAYPFTPSKFLFLELLIIGLASIALAVEPNEKRIEGSFIERVVSSSIPAALAMFVPILTILLVGRFSGTVDVATRDSVAMCVVTLVGYINLLYVCYPFTKWRAFVAGLVGVLLAIVIPVGAVVDALLLGGKMFDIPAAANDPVFLLSMLGIAVVFTVAIQAVRRPLVALCRRIMSRKAK